MRKFSRWDWVELSNLGIEGHRYHEDEIRPGERGVVLGFDFSGHEHVTLVRFPSGDYDVKNRFLRRVRPMSAGEYFWMVLWAGTTDLVLAANRREPAPETIDLIDWTP